MTREEKVKLVEELSEELKDVGGLVVCGFSGLTVPEMEALRNEAKEQDLKVRVIKNRLAAISFKNAGIEGLTLKNTNIFVWGDDIVALAKVVTKYASENKDKFTVKSGYFENNVVDAAQIEAYSKLASKKSSLECFFLLGLRLYATCYMFGVAFKESLLPLLMRLKNKKKRLNLDFAL